MSLLFVDSYDHYTTLLQKWDSTSGNGSGVIGTGSARTGLNGVALGGSSQGFNIFKNIPARNSIVMGFAINVQSGTTKLIWSAGDANGTHISLQLGTGSLQFFRGAGSTAIGPASTIVVPSGSFVYIEVKVLISSTVGTVECHVNGVTAIPSTGSLNTQGSTTTNITFVGIGGPQTTSWFFDDVYVCDTLGTANNNFLGNTAIKCVLPTANGTTNQWTKAGSTPAATNWQSVNENPPDDGVTLVQDATVGHIDRYTFPAITANTVAAVVVNLRANEDAVGTRSIRAAVKSGATLGDNGVDFALNTTFTDYQGIFETDPNTAAAWAVAAVNAAEFGEKVTV
jgi:hypothetical protein